MLFAKKMQVNLPKMDMPVNFSYLWGRNFNWAKSPNSRSVLVFIKVSHIFKGFHFNPIKKLSICGDKNRNILTNLQLFLYYGPKLLNWPVIQPCAGIIAIHRKGVTTLHAKKIKISFYKLKRFYQKQNTHHCVCWLLFSEAATQIFISWPWPSLNFSSISRWISTLLWIISTQPYFPQFIPNAWYKTN